MAHKTLVVLIKDEDGNDIAGLDVPFTVPLAEAIPQFPQAMAEWWARLLELEDPDNA